MGWLLRNVATICRDRLWRCVRNTAESRKREMVVEKCVVELVLERGDKRHDAVVNGLKEIALGGKGVREEIAEAYTRFQHDGDIDGLTEALAQIEIREDHYNSVIGLKMSTAAASRGNISAGPLGGHDIAVRPSQVPRVLLSQSPAGSKHVRDPDSASAQAGRISLPPGSETLSEPLSFGAPAHVVEAMQFRSASGASNASKFNPHDAYLNDAAKPSRAPPPISFGGSADMHPRHVPPIHMRALPASYDRQPPRNTFLDSEMKNENGSNSARRQGGGAPHDFVQQHNQLNAGKTSSDSLKHCITILEIDIKLNSRMFGRPQATHSRYNIRAHRSHTQHGGRECQRFWSVLL